MVHHALRRLIQREFAFFHTAMVACISIGLCVSAGVTYVTSSFTGALAAPHPRRHAAVVRRRRPWRQVEAMSGVFASYLTFTRRAASCACWSVFATTSATNWP